MFEILCAIALVIGISGLAQDLSSNQTPPAPTVTEQPWEH